MLEIEQCTQRAIDQRVFPGCVIGILKEAERTVQSFGKLRYEEPALVTEDTVYDLASITKSIPLASLAAILIEERTCALSDTVTKFLPELQNDFDATIEDLLRYRVRGPQLSKLQYRTFEEIRTYVLEHGFDGPPGEGQYTNLPAFVLGLAIERVKKESLASLGHRYFFGPLHMESTTFFPATSDCAPTENDARGEVRGLPHDESAYVFAKAHRTVGHAGLFSTANDMLTFAEKLLHDPQGAIVRNAENGLGWQVKDPNFMGRFAGEKTFGKTGFTGTSIVVDVERQIALVILSNRTYPVRPIDDSAIFQFRRDIADIVLETT